MTSTSSWRGRWLVLIVAVVLIIGVAAALVWATRGTESAGSQQDCPLVEELGQEWLSTEVAVRQQLEQGSGEPSDYRSIAEREAAIAEKLRTGADSASSPEIKEQLKKWADGAALFAKTQRDVAERPTGSPPDPSAQSDFVDASKTADDAAAALREFCPNMPTGTP